MPCTACRQPRARFFAICEIDSGRIVYCGIRVDDAAELLTRGRVSGKAPTRAGAIESARAAAARILVAWRRKVDA